MAYESTTFEREGDISPEGLRDRAQSVMKRARARGTEAIQDTTDVIRRHPGKTVALSLMAGGLVGALIVNALMKEDDAGERWDALAELGASAWEKVKGGAMEAVCAAREAVDKAIARYR